MATRVLLMWSEDITPVKNPASGVFTREAPQSLVMGGMPVFGHFDGMVKTLGLEQFHLTDELDKPLPHWQQRLHFKQQEFISIHSSRYLLGVGLTDIGYSNSGYCYLFDQISGKLFQQRWQYPIALKRHLAYSPWQGISNGKGIVIKREQGQWQLILRLSLQHVDINAELTLTPGALSLPMTLCCPSGYNGWSYAQQHSGLKLSGQLAINHEPQPLSRTRGGYGFWAGYTAGQSHWRWVCINGDYASTPLALNLASGINDTGSCQNVLWQDGARHLLTPVHFNVDHRSGREGRWRIWSEREELDLWFTPTGHFQLRQRGLRHRMLRRHYHGMFEGWVRDGTGQQQSVKQQPGIAEDFFAIW
ncbi:DUF2804 family protein [Shewanella sp. 4t3-1-2LB]|uniref:DUF2804 family protein n=1 Tax=Shewanella sp. 4t3-1-2LB TaxID=2817682 RepID=UPI001A983BF0|nr:DUF2804 family protein [Shewanella sp. 4t3-1-2LB]MBO1270495.1 DUF2804 family protein [Shewanella sp. 4t3-1-2LB]